MDRTRSGHSRRARAVGRLTLCLAVLAGGCSWAARPDPDVPWIARGSQGMIASDSVFASRAGLEILQQGGNAIDAAAATSLALAVTRPYSMGLGGGGFALVRLGATGEVFVLDYRERAPAAATPDMYVKARASRPEGAPPSQFGGLAVGVPGLLAGHGVLIERFGTRPWRELVAPAAHLAGEGFPIDEHYRGGMRAAGRSIARHPELRAATTFLRRRFLFDEKKPPAGTILEQPELARTLTAIGEQGPGYLYRGPPAEAIARTVGDHRGIITPADLAAYRPTWREPIRARYRERFEILLMPPPSSGGICLAQTLNILEHWDLRALAPQDPGLAAHLTIEALRHAFADRARHLGDADFAAVPVAKLTSKGYAAELAARIRPDGVAEPDAYGFALADDAGTSHYCIADRWGNVVSATETINTSFGSLLAVESLGIVLNNEMDDFTAEPGKVNLFGLRQSDANVVAPGKRPLSSMSPTIVLDRGKPILAVGASGGPRIITATLQVMLDVIEYDRTLAESLERPRFHHQWQPNLLYRNAYAADDPVMEALRGRGHTISDDRRGAVVQALRIEGDRFIGASDPRKGGQPAGY